MHDICLSALCNLPINRWISQVELIPLHLHRPRPVELDCFEYENFAYTARQLQELHTKSHMLNTIPDQHYAQFLNDISYHLLQKVCSLASLFTSPRPVHIYQKIGMVILDYLRDLRSDWFGGAHQLAQAFQGWHLPVELPPSVAASVAVPVAASVPVLQTSAQQEHQKKVDLMMKTHEK